MLSFHHLDITHKSEDFFSCFQSANKVWRKIAYNPFVDLAGNNLLSLKLTPKRDSNTGVFL